MVPPDSTLFDEKAADAAVDHSLRSEIARLREELKMVKVIKSVDGKYYTGEFEEVSPEAVTEMIAHKQHQLAELEAIAPAADQSNGGQDNGQPTQPPADGGQPADNGGTPSADGGTPATPPADPNAPTAPATPPADGQQVTPPINQAPSASAMPPQTQGEAPILQ